jgi:hypothetical protein
MAGPVENLSSNEGEGAGLLSKRREQQLILLDIRREDAHFSSSYLILSVLSLYLVLLF